MARRLLEKTFVEKPGVEWAEKRGVVVTKGAVQGRNGWPDRVYWFYGGRPFLAELKSPGWKPEPLQAYIIQQLKDLKYDVEFYDNKEEFLAALEKRHLDAKARKKEDDANSRRLLRSARR